MLEVASQSQVSLIYSVEYLFYRLFGIKNELL